MPKYKFSEIAYNINQKKIPEPGDEAMYIGLEHLDSGSLKVSRGGSDVPITGEKLVMKKGDVLFGRRNTYLRRAAIAPHDGIFSAHGMIFRPNTDVIDEEYFPFFISSDYFMNAAIRISVGSLSPTVNWKTLKDLEFDIPDLESQRKSAELLTSANELKEAYEILLEQTDKLVKSQFIELTQDVETVNLADVCKSYGRGKTPKYVDDSKIRILNQACIYWDGFRLQNVKFQNEEKFVFENKLRQGDVLLNSTGTGTLGRAHVFDIVDEYHYMTDSHVTILRPDTKIIHPVVLQYYFYDDFNQSELYRLCVFGSTSQAELSKEALGRMQLPIVNEEKQKQFVDFVKQSDKSKFEIKKSIENINELIKSLLQQDFNI